MNDDVNENVETFFLDESGTPADFIKDSLFITAGFIIRGDTS